MIKKIPLEKAQPGMILAQQIIRDDGVLLCQKGSELTGSLLKMLERLNYETVQIEVGATETSEEQAARLAKEEAELQNRFVKVESDPVLAELKRVLLKRLKEAG
ncbi:MAG: hypothetical protein JRI95_00680 [Deltaproteobacteria bacterium]|nr:hypothetical protein [Deltaproteobacteria bacterium]